MSTLSPYVAVDGVEITSFLREGAPEPIKPTRKVQDEPIIGTNRAVLSDEGQGALGYKATCSFKPDQYASYDTVAGAFRNIEDGDLFYPRYGRFMVCWAGHSDPIKSITDARDGEMFRLEGTVWSEAAELYDATASTWSPTDEDLPVAQTSGVTNAGNLEAALYSLSLTARMSGPALKCDGTNDYITDDIDLSGDLLSVSVKVYISDALDAYFFQYFSTGVSDAGAVSLYTTTGPALRGYSGASGGNTFGAITTGWHTIGFSYSKTANQMKAYLDGVQSGSTWSPGSALASIQARTLFLARSTTNYSPLIYADLRIWQRILSDSEFLAAHNTDAVSSTSLILKYDFCEGRGTTVYDLTGNGNDGTLTNFADTSAGYGDSHDGGWLTSIGPVSPTLQHLTAADAIDDQMVLTPGLMTAEALTQDRFGQISQDYEADFTAGVGRSAFGGYFWADGIAKAKYVDSHIIFTSAIPNRVGEETTLRFVNPGGDDTLEVNVSGSDIVVTLGYSSGAINTTYQNLIDLLNADGDVLALGSAELASGEDGSTLVSALSETALALNVDVTGGSLVIEDDREAEYHLVGSWPVDVGGLMVSFTPTISGDGVASLEVSIDSGATWETVITSATWTDGSENEVYVPQAEGNTDIRVRWACDSSITSLSLSTLRFHQERYVSYSEVPKIPIGATRKISLDGDGWGAFGSVHRNRYQP